MKAWPKYSGREPWISLHILFRGRLGEERNSTKLVARLPLTFSGRGNEAYGPTSTTPSKTDVHKQTKWQQTGGGGEGGWRRMKSRRRRRRDTVQKWNVFMFSCPTNGSYFPPLCSIWADITHDTVGAIKQTFDERFPWWAVCAVTPCDFLQQSRHGLCLYRDGWQQLVMRSFEVEPDSYMRLLLLFYKIQYLNPRCLLVIRQRFAPRNHGRWSFPYFISNGWPEKSIQGEVLKYFTQQLQGWQSVKPVMKPAHPALKNFISMDLECAAMVQM